MKRVREPFPKVFSVQSRSLTEHSHYGHEAWASYNPTDVEEPDGSEETLRTNPHLAGVSRSVADILPTRVRMTPDLVGFNQSRAAIVEVETDPNKRCHVIGKCMIWKIFAPLVYVPPSKSAAPTVEHHLKILSESA